MDLKLLASFYTEAELRLLTRLTIGDWLPKNAWGVLLAHKAKERFSSTDLDQEPVLSSREYTDRSVALEVCANYLPGFIAAYHNNKPRVELNSFICAIAESANTLCAPINAEQYVDIVMYACADTYKELALRRFKKAKHNAKLSHAKRSSLPKHIPKSDTVHMTYAHFIGRGLTSIPVELY